MWFSKLTFSLIIFYIFYISVVFSTKHNTIRGNKFLCGIFAPDIVTHLSCKFKRVNRTTEFWSYTSTYAPGVVLANEHTYVTIYSRHSNLEWRPHMVFNYHIDVCKWVDRTMNNQIMDVLLEDLKKKNFVNRCPHKGTYSLVNMTFDDSHFPPIVPSADIYLDFVYHTYINGKMRKTYYLRPYVEVKTKGIFYWR